MSEGGDEHRLSVLHASRLLDSPREAAFDRLTRLAAGLLHARVSLVSLVDETREFFKSAYGLAEPWASRREAPLTHSFCKYATRERANFVVNDAREDPVLRDNLAVRDLAVIAYLGIPLLVEDEAIGAFCVTDDKPRAWSEREIRLLVDLAESVVSEIELRAALRTSHEQRSLANALLEEIGDGVLALDASRTFIMVNAEARRIFANGAVAGKPLPSNWAELHRSMRADGSLLRSEDGALGRALHGQNTDGLEFTLERPGSDAVIWVEASGRPVRDQEGQVVAAVAVYRDVTKRKAEAAELETARGVLEQQARALHEASVTDELTGLLNRRGFMLIAGQEIKVADRKREKVFLVFIDLNGMKTINDTLGHGMGDRALVDTASLLRKVFRSSDVIARLGGDEFVVLAIDSAVTSGPVFAVRLRHALVDYNASTSPFRLSLSLGTSIFDPKEPSTLEKLLSDADAQMYKDKQTRRESALHRIKLA